MGELTTIVFVGSTPSFREHLEGLRAAGIAIGVNGKAITSLTRRYVRYTGDRCLRGMTGPAELVIGHDATSAQVEQARTHIAIMNQTVGRMITVYVEGRPAPQGSKRISPTGAMREQSPYLVGWAGGWKGAKARGVRVHGAVEVAVYRWYQEHQVSPEQLVGGYVKGPIDVTITFYLDPAHGPIDDPPDIDKLARATFDALTAARAWTDDGKVVETHLRKRAADANHPAGAYIMIREATL